jgi:hypothetical protein
MRDLHRLDQYRDTGAKVIARFGSAGDSGNGVFHLPNGLLVLASNGEGWDHVSISAPGRCPTWEEMSAVKDLFFRPNEVAMQLHVPDKDHINYHPYTLHLWRPQYVGIPRPPANMVGPKAVDKLANTP